jgi:hypothetical protein
MLQNTTSTIPVHRKQSYSLATMPIVKMARHFTCKRCANPLIDWSSGRRPEAIKTTFSTSDELDKHLRTEHKSAMYSCTAVGCLKGKSAPKFQKPETLTQHIKESHAPDTIFSCPVKTCTFEPSKLDEVAIHAHWMHIKRPSEVGTRQSLHRCHDASIDAVINAASWNYFRCPIWNCRKFISGGFHKVSAHLLVHLPIELEKAQDQLASNGYEIHLDSDDPGMSIGFPHVSSVQIRCPVCKTQCQNDQNFKHHLEADHMIAGSPDMLEHFETWRKDVTSWTVQAVAKHVSHRPCWLHRVPGYRYGVGGVARRVVRHRSKFRTCSYSTCSFNWKQGGEDHPSFLRPAEDIATTIWPHRIRILRHYPQFLTHPMFQQHASNPES